MKPEKRSGLHIITLNNPSKKSYYESNAGTNAAGFEGSSPGFPPWYFGPSSGLLIFLEKFITKINIKCAKCQIHQGSP